MPTLNTDCHIILTHPDVNAGSSFGFILDLINKQKGQFVSVQREIDSDGTNTIRIFFNVLLADNLIDPDGGQHSDNKDTMYAKIVDYLSKLDGITINTPIGIFSNVGALGHSSTEQHFKEVSIVACMFNNSGPYYPPADPDFYYNSEWDGTLTWATSYWR